MNQVEQETIKSLMRRINELEIENKLISKALAANSFTCHDCDTLSFGKPACVHSACAEHGEQKVCPTCYNRQEDEDARRLRGESDG